MEFDNEVYNVWTKGFCFSRRNLTTSLKLRGEHGSEGCGILFLGILPD